jgi:uncharacterized protein DUF2281
VSFHHSVVFLKFVFVKVKAMSDAMLLAHISALPDNLKAEVADFVAFLEQKHKPEHKIKERQFGAFKGRFVMSPDFDEPLEDFKDYM